MFSAQAMPSRRRKTRCGLKLGFDLTIEQSQKLVMTPELIQSIKLLQLSMQELDAYLDEQLLSNPVLE